MLLTSPLFIVNSTEETYVTGSTTNTGLAANPCYYVIVGRGFVNSLFYEDPLTFSTLSSLTSTPTALFVALFLWLNGWSHHIRCVILLNDMDLQMLGLGALVPEGLCSVFYAASFHVYWGLTHSVVFS